MFSVLSSPTIPLSPMAVSPGVVSVVIGSVFMVVGIVGVVVGTVVGLVVGAAVGSVVGVVMSCLPRHPVNTQRVRTSTSAIMLIFFI